MGLKRIMYQAEATFPADDPRTLDDLSSAVAGASWTGLRDAGGELARLTVVSKAVDPDPEPTIETLETTEPADPTAPGGPLEWA